MNQRARRWARVGLVLSVAALALLAGSLVPSSSEDGEPAPSAEQPVGITVARPRESVFALEQLERLLSRIEAPLRAEVVHTYPFVWPVRGDITSYIGPEHPAGIDIGVASGVLVPIGSVAGGVVSFAGGSPSGDYGYYVKLDHGHGVETLYAHLSEIVVSQGEVLAQGQTLGYGGSTGKSSGLHLHLELRYMGQILDPLEWLPVETEAPPSATMACGSAPLELERGAAARLDFSASLSGYAITGARIRDGGEGALLRIVEVQEERAVVLASPPGFSFAATDLEQAYTVELVLTGSLDERTVSCDVVVQTRTGVPLAYVRPAPAAEDLAVVAEVASAPPDGPVEVDSPAATAVPVEPTATPESIQIPDVPMLAPPGVEATPAGETSTPVTDPTPAETPVPDATATPSPAAAIEPTPTFTPAATP